MFSLNLKLISLSLFLVLLDWRGWLEPFKRPIISLSLPVGQTFDLAARQLKEEAQFWVDLRNLHETNRRLSRRAEELLSRLADLKETLRENDLLRSQLAIPSKSGEKSLVLARVAGRLPQRPTVVLAQLSTGASVKKGDLAVYRNFVFGKVLSLSGSLVQVQLITDPEIFFDGRDVDADLAKGEVRGNFGTALIMSKILPTEAMKEGDTIVDVASGYVLGRVVSVEEAGTEILKTAFLTVPYELEKVEKVFIQVSD